MDDTISDYFGSFDGGSSYSSCYPIATVLPLLEKPSLCTLLTALSTFIYIYTWMDDDPYVPSDHRCVYVYKFLLNVCVYMYRCTIMSWLPILVSYSCVFCLLGIYLPSLILLALAPLPGLPLLLFSYCVYMYIYLFIRWLPFVVSYCCSHLMHYPATFLLGIHAFLLVHQ